MRKFRKFWRRARLIITHALILAFISPQTLLRLGSLLIVFVFVSGLGVIHSFRLACAIGGRKK
jgi:hypothetical protein